MGVAELDEISFKFQLSPHTTSWVALTQALGFLICDTEMITLLCKATVAIQQGTMCKLLKAAPGMVGRAFAGPVRCSDRVALSPSTLVWLRPLPSGSATCLQEILDTFPAGL